MRTPIRRLALSTALLLALAGCSDDGGETPAADGDENQTSGATTVQVDDNVFEPETVEIAVGDTVTWEWVGTQPHNVRADAFESELQTEGTFEHTFEEAGSIPYVCTVHPGMEGTVEVAG